MRKKSTPDRAPHDRELPAAEKEAWCSCRRGTWSFEPRTDRRESVAAQAATHALRQRRRVWIRT
ncbi:MAG: hypothetical protein VB111_05990 [Clostridiaceae bacterium]|nr:hypothetical protein [Clostridiaceae bacterium]